METTKQYCPICKTEVNINLRYPKYVCNDCFEKAVDKNGRKLLFGNIGIWGGFSAIYDDTKEEYKSNICYIKGVECKADEARFGGIVIEKK